MELLDHVDVRDFENEFRLSHELSAKLAYQAYEASNLPQPRRR